MNLGAASAVVVALKPGTADGAPSVAVGVRFEDGRVEHADLRADLVPDGLQIGDAVSVTKAALYHRWEIKKTG